MTNFLRSRIITFARLNHVMLTEEHWKVLEYAHSYYEKNRVGPLFRNIEKNTSASRLELEKLFPYGLNSIYTWIGIPIQAPEQSCKPLAKVKVDNPRDVYLDHNATTYTRKEINSLLLAYFSESHSYGNPSSSTILGDISAHLLEEARKKLATCLQVNPGEIIFTSGGTESNNTAIKGIAFQYLNKEKKHIISSTIEHPSVINTLKFLETLGFQISYIQPEADGIVAAEKIQKAITTDTILISIMAVNNEIGTINPVKEIGEIAKQHQIPFMVDAVQAFGKLSINPKDNNITLMSFSGHKIYAPKGIGALYIDQKQKILPSAFGGSQEFKLRAGTENVSGIISFAKAAELAFQEREQEQRRLLDLRNYLLDNLHKIEPALLVNGSLENRIAGNLNIGFPDIDSGALLLSLNEIGVYVSAGSACSAGSTEQSHVIKALNVDTDKYGSIRFSLGLCNNKEDIDYLLQYLPSLLKELKNQ